MREVRIDDLLGRTVRDADGRVLGPVEELHVAEHDGEAFVVAYCVGAYGLFQRLAGTAMRSALLRAFGRAQRGGAYVVPWDRMDLSDRRSRACAVRSTSCGAPTTDGDEATRARPMKATRSAIAMTVVLILSTAAGCSRESRAVAADQPQTPPNGADDPRVDRYQENAYQIAQGGRYFTWYGCGGCHASGARGPLDLGQPVRRHGSGFDQAYRYIAEGHRTPDVRYGERVPVEQLWQITAYVRELPTLDPEQRRRQDLDQAGEPQGTGWSGPVR